MSWLHLAIIGAAAAKTTLSLDQNLDQKRALRLLTGFPLREGIKNGGVQVSLARWALGKAFSRSAQSSPSASPVAFPATKLCLLFLAEFFSFQLRLSCADWSDWDLDRIGQAIAMFCDKVFADYRLCRSYLIPIACRRILGVASTHLLTCLAALIRWVKSCGGLAIGPFPVQLMRPSPGGIPEHLFWRLETLVFSFGPVSHALQTHDPCIWERCAGAPVGDALLLRSYSLWPWLHHRELSIPTYVASRVK